MIVVTLGHRLTGPSIHPHLRERVDRGIEATVETDASHLLCSGGRANDAVDRSEAAVMAEYARNEGLAADRILLERNSLDTIGNAFFTRRVLDERGIDTDTIQLVTSLDHVGRAAYAFEQCVPTVDVETDYLVNALTYDSGSPLVDRGLARMRAFFDPIEPGDVDAIGRRLLDEHDYYGPDAFSSPSNPGPPHGRRRSGEGRKW